MKEKRDILAERTDLKEMPYSLPKGYFEEFRTQMKPYRRQPVRKRTPYYVSAAASLALLIAAGAVLANRTSPTDEFTHEDFLVFTEATSALEYYDDHDLYADAEIANDDIRDYLIDNGVTAEEVELYK